MKRLIFSLMLFAGMYSLPSCEKANDSTNGAGNHHETIDLMDHFYQREWVMKNTYTYKHKVYEDSCYIFFAERDTAFISDPLSNTWESVRYEIDGIKFQIFGASGMKYEYPYYLFSYENGEYILIAKYTDPYDSELTLREKERTRSTEW